MTKRSRPPSDEVPTDKHAPVLPRTRTRKGRPLATGDDTEQTKVERRVSKRTKQPKPFVPLVTPTVVDPRRPFDEAVSARDSGEIRVISMKTPEPADAAEDPVREPQKVKLRAMSEVGIAVKARDLGRLAPPRDPKEARARRVRDYVIWGCVVVMLACGVTLAIWFLGRR